MNCPACKNMMKEIIVGGVAVDVCTNGCGGLWFDNQELKKFDEPFEAAGEQLLDYVRQPHVQVDLSERRHCPRCEDHVIMMQHYFSVKRHVAVDECPECGGIWLDLGELRTIRDQFGSEEERHEAASACFEEIFGAEIAQKKTRSPRTGRFHRPHQQST